MDNRYEFEPQVYQPKISDQPRTDHLAEKELIDGYFYWKNVAVSYFGGTRLLLSDSTPFEIPLDPNRRLAADIVIDHISWQSRPIDPGHRIASVEGTGPTAPNLKFDNYPMLCVVFCWISPQGTILGTRNFREPCSFDSPNRFPHINPALLSFPLQCVIQVNDVNHIPFYEDNAGGFDLYAKIS